MLFNTLSVLCDIVVGYFCFQFEMEERKKIAELRRENCMRDLVLRTYKNMYVSKHLCYNKHFC